MKIRHGRLFGFAVFFVAAMFSLAGCLTDVGGDDGPTKYTVTFDPNNGIITSGQAVQEVEEGKYAAIPTVTPPDGKETDGWDSSVASIASPASPITANVTFTAKWKNKANNNPIPSANPLLGAWYNGGTANNPNELLIFSGSSGGRQYFYGLWAVSVENNTDTSNKLVHISGVQYVYEVSGNTLTVKNYVDAIGVLADVPFTRIEGSTKTDEHDVWYTASRTNTDVNRTILVIKSNNVTFSAVGTGGVENINSVWDRWEYAPDSSKNRIDWKDDNTATPYSLDGSTLTIPNWSGDYTKSTL
jgi:hypothetical protein